MSKQEKNTFTKAQLQAIIEQMEFLEAKNTKIVTSVQVAFDEGPDGRIAADKDGEFLFTPTYHTPYTGGYMDR